MRKPELRFVNGVSEGVICVATISSEFTPIRHRPYPRRHQRGVPVLNRAVVGVENLCLSSAAPNAVVAGASARTESSSSCVCPQKIFAMTCGEKRSTLPGVRRS